MNFVVRISRGGAQRSRVLLGVLEWGIMGVNCRRFFIESDGEVFSQTQSSTEKFTIEQLISRPLFQIRAGKKVVDLPAIR